MIEHMPWYIFSMNSPACVCAHTERICYKRNNNIWSKITSAGSFLHWGEGNTLQHVVFVVWPGLSKVAVIAPSTSVLPLMQGTMEKPSGRMSQGSVAAGVMDSPMWQMAGRSFLITVFNPPSGRSTGHLVCGYHQSQSLPTSPALTQSPSPSQSSPECYDLTLQVIPPIHFLS
jgi:hypothetical protein